MSLQIQSNFVMTSSKGLLEHKVLTLREGSVSSAIVVPIVVSVALEPALLHRAFFILNEITVKSSGSSWTG